MKQLLLYSLLLLSFDNFAQNDYFILFKDKVNSPYSISKPQEFLSERSIARRKKQNIKINERDLPPNPSYLNQLSQSGAKILYKSRWNNGVLVNCSPTILEKILKLPFVRGIEGNLYLKNFRNSSVTATNKRTDKFKTIETEGNGLSQTQLAMLGADQMHQRGFRGEGMLIGVLDSGFQNAPNLSFFRNLFNEKRVIYTFDFVNNESNVYNDHYHGTNVLSCMAAYEQDKIVGTAYQAKYVLLTTEDVSSETKREEANWLFGAELADSLGVDVINSSLGYTEFDIDAQNYTYRDLNGDRALATRAADWAAQAGILVVASAGNEGNSSWKYIGSPADADSIIAVGAVNGLGNPAFFSSFGPTSDGRIKPELAAQGQSIIVGNPNNTIGTSNGTSFSSPLMAGFVASFWQAFPQLTNMQIRDILIRSASLYDTPSNRLGYGIPNFDKAYQIAEIIVLLDELKKSGKDVAVFPNPVDDNTLKVWVLKEDAGNNYEFAILAPDGKKIWQNEGKVNKISADISQIPSGKYIIYVKSENLQFSQWFIK